MWLESEYPEDLLSRLPAGKLNEMEVFGGALEVDGNRTCLLYYFTATKVRATVFLGTSVVIAKCHTPGNAVVVVHSHCKDG